MTQRKKIKDIVITGRRWFDRINGNTYHSVKCWVNGDLLVNIPFCYGYEDQYQYTAFNELIKMGVIKSEPNLVFWRWCEDNKVKKIVEVSDVQRKKDL